MTVNLGLHKVSKKYAKKLFDSLSKTYDDEFNITFDVLGMYKHKLPSSWDFHNEAKILKGRAKKSSDIYVILTGVDWNDNKNKGTSKSVAGQASSDHGYIWMETKGKYADVTHTLLHEVSHLFKASHVYKTNALMHPYNSGSLDFTAKTKAMILKNKFRSWGPFSL